MILQEEHYVPTLAVRASEMNGLEFLPSATKDRMRPCFLLAPWANSNSIERTITRIERAFPNRNYFLEIDRDYEFTNIESEPQRQLANLLDPSDCYANWRSFVSEHVWIWPCVQTRGQSRHDIRRQIEAFQNQGRCYCMRIVRDRFPENLQDIVEAFAESGTADFIIILEGGWTRDPLNLALWFIGIITAHLQEIDADVPVVVSCTSIPKMYTSFSADEPTVVPFHTRQLVEQVARNSNRARVIYGDWASTRPRDNSGFASRPVDRVDYPSDQAWLISRNRDKNWTFREAAQAIVGQSIYWDGHLGVWGEEMIYNTTINPELGINTPQKNVAARVNIHLHRQAFYGEQSIDPGIFDEEWKD